MLLPEPSSDIVRKYFSYVRKVGCREPRWSEGDNWVVLDHVRVKMTIYSINYDLKKPGRDYEGLYTAIKGCGDWWHYLESTWLVDTALNLTASGIGSKAMSMPTTVC
jgi:hypothetical protein